MWLILSIVLFYRALAEDLAPSTFDTPSESWRLQRSFCSKEFHWTHANANQSKTSMWNTLEEKCPFTRKWGLFNCKGREEQLLAYDLMSSCCKAPVNFTLQENVFSCMRDKRILFYGDSLTRNHFLAYACLIWSNAKYFNAAFIARTGKLMKLILPEYKFTTELVESHETAAFATSFMSYLNNSYLNDSIKTETQAPNIVVLGTGHHWAPEKTRPGYTSPDLELKVTSKLGRK